MKNRIEGVIVRRYNVWRIAPHGRLHDEYQRGDLLCPGELSVAAVIINSDGGHRYSVRTCEAEIANSCTTKEHYWIARRKPWDRAQPFIVIRDPVLWEDILWLHQECELTLLTWLRDSNDPDAWKIPGLGLFLLQREKKWIARIGEKEYKEQFRKFWGMH